MEALFLKLDLFDDPLMFTGLLYASCRGSLIGANELHILFSNFSFILNVAGILVRPSARFYLRCFCSQGSKDGLARRKMNLPNRVSKNISPRNWWGIVGLVAGLAGRPCLCLCLQRCSISSITSIP